MAPSDSSLAVRIGSAYAIDRIRAVHKACSTFPVLVFEARPVIPVEDAGRVELEAIAWRDGLKRKWGDELVLKTLLAGEDFQPYPPS